MQRCQKGDLLESQEKIQKRMQGCVQNRMSKLKRKKKERKELSICIFKQSPRDVVKANCRPPPPRIGTPTPRHAPSTQRQPLSCVSFYRSKFPQHPSILTAHSFILLLLASLLFPEYTRHIPTPGPLYWLCPLHIPLLPRYCTHGSLPHLYCVFLS